MEKYSPAAVESKWQKFWKEQKLFKAEKDPNKTKRYILTMFPYPSGALHIGHVMNYTIGDVIVRYSIMQGYSVFSPIGWDSFGLPAENAAIREGIPPAEYTKANIAKMKEQMDRAGWGFDWDREIATSSIEYYRWTQWLFLRFHKAGCVERKKAPVNWCSSCKTVLANEQVHNGCCERCDSLVEQKDLEQWFFSMSRYAEKLLANHEKIKEWPEKVIKMQQEWIGRSEGSLIEFKLDGNNISMPIFTTRPDTLHGVTFMSIASQHPLIEELVKDQPNRDEIMKEVQRMRAQGTSELEMLEREKEGIFTGRYIINPVNGERVPLWIANFVLMSYGTGIIMAVPAHDQRDFEFAKKYDIPIKVVIQPAKEELNADTMTCAYVDEGVMVDSGEFSGCRNFEAIPDINDWLQKKGFGRSAVNYRLRDWLISRQRYWGVPIPMIYCDTCGIVPVPDDQLPVKLPENVEFRPSGESPLALCEEFINTTCPQCGGNARRESDTMDTFVDSSWYYLRYVSPHFDRGPFEKEEVKRWCPVDVYIGGVEHATMHLIYVRFFTYMLNELGLIDFEEPATKLFCQGMVNRIAYYCDKDKWVSEDQVKDGVCTICGGPVTSEITKMSKTKLNVVSPEEIIERFGADTMRMYMLADNPPDKGQVWSEEGVLGVNRFMNRLWDTFSELQQKIPKQGAEPKVQNDTDKKIRFVAHNALKKCTQTFEHNWQFNTAIARVMELLNAIRGDSDAVSGPVLREAIEILLKLIAPISPHIAEELWERIGYKESIFRSPMPSADESALDQETITIVVQINGKLRGNFEAAPDSVKEEMEKAALGLEKVKKHIEGKKVRKVVVVPNKLVNIVTN